MSGVKGMRYIRGHALHYRSGQATCRCGGWGWKGKPRAGARRPYFQHLDEQDCGFHTGYVKEPNTGCWLWTGSLTTVGYGQFFQNGKRTHAHRVSWEQTNGPIPDGLFVLHKCDVRSCVNPKHLFLGTHADNMADAVSKKRMRHGENHPKTTLTDTQVREIRVSTEAGRRLAARLGVSHSTVWGIRSGQRRTVVK